MLIQFPGDGSIKSIHASMVVKHLGPVAIVIILPRAFCLTLEKNEFGCYEAKVHIEDCEDWCCI